MDPPILVLRAQEDADPLVAALLACGRAAIVAPCLHYERVPLAVTFLDRWRGHALDLVVTSPRAAFVLRDLRLDEKWRVLALAGATAAALHAAGVRVDTPVDGGAAEAAGLTRVGPVVALGSDLAGEQLRSVRPDATVLVAYRTRCPDTLPEAATVALLGEFSLFAASPSSLRHFNHLAPGALLRAHAVWCHGRSTLAEARTLGATRCFLRDEQELLHATPPSPPPL